MNLAGLTEITLSMYHNGTIKSTNQQLTKGIIAGYLRTAYGVVIQQMMDKKERKGETDSSYVISGAVQTEKITLEKIGIKSVADLSSFDVMRLDKGMDIISFEQPAKYDSCIGGVMQPITYVSPFELRFYLGADFKDQFFYVRTRDGVDIYNLPDCLKDLNISFVDGSGKADIPEDVGLNMLKIAFPDVFGVKKFGKDKIDDNSNDAIHNFKMMAAANGG